MMASPTAIVTGGSSGIGAETARMLHDAGYQVLIVGRNYQRLERVASERPRMLTMVEDLSTPTANKKMIEAAAHRLGRIDVLVNAAGTIGASIDLERISEEEWMEAVNTNLLGPIAATTAAIPYLKESTGSVVNVSSVNAILAEPNLAPYGVTKSALSGFTKFAAADLGRYGVRVNAVLPGWVNTPLVAGELERAGIVGGQISTNFLHRIAVPSEIAKAIVFLASESASYITGECLVVDGGHSIYSRDLLPFPD